MMKERERERRMTEEGRADNETVKEGKERKGDENGEGLCLCAAMERMKSR
jgi:hypothetical protein